jgi:hypothetical protein
MAASPEMGGGMKLRALLLIASCLLITSTARASVYVVAVAGLSGEPDYEQRFTAAAKDLEKSLAASEHLQVLAAADATREKLTQALATVAREARAEDDFVLILIGHGSFDGVEYKLNLVGPDISAAELAALCNRVPSRRQLIVNATSASGGSIAALQRNGRAVVSATKSGTEKNATVFARYWVMYADRKTAEFYTSQKRLATEHPVFEDTGKGQPVRAAQPEIGEGRLLSSLILVRLGEAQRAALDPAKRDLLAKKDDLERQIDALKFQKAAMAQSEYESQLKALLLDLARVQTALDK